MESKTFFVHTSSVIDEDVEIGMGTHIWHFCHLMPGCKIGAQCNIGQNVYVDSGVIIGNRVKIQNNVSVYKGVTIEDDVFLGPSMVFTNVINPRSFINRKDQMRLTIVRKGATVGANATIVCGTEIGSYALIGAGTVITKDVPAYAIFVGNPGRQTGWVSRNGHPLKFDVSNIAACPQTGEHYRLQNDQVELA